MSEVAGGTQKDSPHDIEADPQARLHRVERQLAEIQRLAHFGSWEWDIATDVVTWSDELYRICGVEPGTLEPTHDAVISQFHPDDRDAVAGAVQRAIAERGSWALDARLVRPDGDVRWLHSLGTPAAVILQAAHVLADSTVASTDRELAMGALTIDIAADITVLAEPIELERAFVHLLANAQVHGGPNISVTASRLADEVSVDVRDDGPGVSNEYLPNLFAPFAERRGAGQGSGLGLAVVHRLMEAFGGSVSYHRAEPHGSVFTLRFSAH